MADIDEILGKVASYNPDADIELIRRAYVFARDSHRDGVRESGDPYIIHPLATAQTLVDLEMDSASIASALLHDVVEDGKKENGESITVEDVRAAFGDEIAGLVDGVTKLKRADFDIREEEEQQEEPRKSDGGKKRPYEFRRSAENLRKIFVAMASDLRVMVIKLADRLHNMSTLDSLPPDKQVRIARETMQIYAPLAHRLGIWRIKWELEDYGFRYLLPEAYAEVAEKVAKTRSEREEDLAEAMEMIQKHLESNGLQVTITARPKHLWSIYQKMQREEVGFSEIYDLLALRVIVNRVGDCYHALGLVHDLWMPIPEKFSDYIAKPKANMYQSLHTKVIGPRGEPLEVQIRTWDMHRLADYGVAAHWQYKEGMRSGDEFERKLSWLRQQLFDWQTDSKDAGEFLHSVIDDLFADKVFLWTPRGDVIDLPAGSTPVDFAYRIHSDVGNHCVGAKVNGRIVPLTHKFHNGDIVEIITRSNSQPSRDWLAFVKTNQARNRIKGFYRQQNYGESVVKGKELLEKELERLGHDPQSVFRSEQFTSVAREMNCHSEDDVYAGVGYGSISVGTVINKLKIDDQTRRPSLVVEVPKDSGRKRLAVHIDGARNMMITRAKCCAPLPGDEVVGYVTRGRGVALHTVDCPNAVAFRNSEPERLMTMDWASSGDRYPTELRLIVVDRVGMLNDITSVISGAKTNIVGAKIKSMPDKTAEVDLTVEVSDVPALRNLLDKVGGIGDVIAAERVTSRKLKAARSR